MPPIKLPIFDPLGILSKPASKLAQNIIDEDIEFNDPIRDFMIDAFGVDVEEENLRVLSERIQQQDYVIAALRDKEQEQDNTAPITPAGPAPRSAQRTEYYAMGDKLLSDSFTCERNRAVAEQVARTFAEGNHRLQLECLHNIRDFTMYPENSEQYNRAKLWLEQHNLKDLLRQAYVNGL